MRYYYAVHYGETSTIYVGWVVTGGGHRWTGKQRSCTRNGWKKKKNKIRHKSVEAVGLIFALKSRKNFVFITLLLLLSVYLRPVTTSRFSTEGRKRRTEGGRRQESPSSDRWRHGLKTERFAVDLPPAKGLRNSSRPPPPPPCLRFTVDYTNAVAPSRWDANAFGSLRRTRFCIGTSSRGDPIGREGIAPRREENAVFHPAKKEKKKKGLFEYHRDPFGSLVL